MTDTLTPELGQFWRETLILASVGTAVCALVSLFSDPRLAVTILAGAVIAGTNLLLLARWIARAIARAVEASNTRVGGDETDTHELASNRPERPGSGLRLALLLLAMLGVLWYMPARPEGMAVGVLIVLVAATIAGFRHNQAI